ncbi:MAG: glutaminyl-peptide cyclotransferase [Bacteroidota bacterium]
MWYKVFIIGLSVVFLTGCNGRSASTRDFSITIESSEKNLRLYDTIKVAVKNKKAIAVDSIVIKIAGNKMTAVNDAIILTDIKPGRQELSVAVFHDGKSQLLKKNITVLSPVAPRRYTYKIINEYPHDMDAYTQGLEFYNDTLYESTGRKGKSELRKIAYKTGEVVARTQLDDTYFGEGLTIMNDKIYVLTWQSGKGFVYDLKTLNLLSSFAYGESKEGWGLCNDGKKLFKSDGTEKIWIVNPETLAEEANIQMVTHTSVFSKANELEYVNGKIYANTYLKDGVMIINPETGIIEGVIDFRGLKAKVTQHEDLDVLNGIAYNPKTKTFFITGKNWDMLFEVVIVEKG